MRHRRLGRKLGVATKHRKSMLRNMVTDLLRNESIKTTDTRAKELKRVAEKMITLAKKGHLHSRRQAAAFIRDKTVLKKLFEEIAQKYKDRPGGYTRIVKLGFRKGDNAPLSILELVEEDFKPKTKKKAKVKEKQKMPKAAVVDAKSSKKESAEELGLIEKEKEAKPEEITSEAGTLPDGKGKEQPATDEEASEEVEAKAEQEPEAREEEIKAEVEPAAETKVKEEKIKTDAGLEEKKEWIAPEKADALEAESKEKVEEPVAEDIETKKNDPEQEAEVTEVKTTEALESIQQVEQPKGQVVEEPAAEQTEEAPEAKTEEPAEATAKEKAEVGEPEPEKVETLPGEAKEPEAKADEVEGKTEESQEASDEEKSEEEKKES